MPANYNTDNARVFGGKNDRIMVAPVGTTLPLDPAELDADGPWVDLGWLDEAGIPLGVATDVEKFKGHQGGATIRTKVTSTEKSLGINALEDAPITAFLFWGGSRTASTTVNGHFRYDMPENIGTVSVAAVVYVEDVDGDDVTWKMYCYEKIEIGEREEVPHANAELTGYRMTAEIIGDSYFVTNAASYDPGTVTPTP